VDEPRRQRPHSSRTGQWWRDVATLIALAGLIVTMVFNTVGVRDTARQAKLQADAALNTRLDAEAGLLTSMSSYLQENDLQLARPEIEQARCDPLDHPLSSREQLRVLATLSGFDYLAWLFNQNRWKLETAAGYWAPRMVYADDVAKNAFQYEEIEQRYVELNRFRSRFPHAERLIPKC
jgi:hypothetical protein